MVTLRLATPDDALACVEIYTPNVTSSACSFEQAPPSAHAMAERIQATLTLAPWLVCEHAGAVLGYAYASRHRERAAYRWSVDASVYVHATSRRLGIAGALYESLFALLRAQGFYAVHAGITLPNAASVSLHESFGFVAVGRTPAVGYKLGAWHDVGYWQLALRARQGTPAPTCRLSQLCRDTQLEAALALGVHRLQIGR
ncbi:MAG: GCN5-related N-acetyltransferase [Myxococcaceae bacterium]|nr:GCN5-related N-acetyltransferase [Myxococcaceae bacterium]